MTDEELANLRGKSVAHEVLIVSIIALLSSNAKLAKDVFMMAETLIDVLPRSNTAEAFRALQLGTEHLATLSKVVELARKNKSHIIKG